MVFLKYFFKILILEKTKLPSMQRVQNRTQCATSLEELHCHLRVGRLGISFTLAANQFLPYLEQQRHRKCLSRQGWPVLEEFLHIMSNPVRTHTRKPQEETLLCVINCVGQPVHPRSLISAIDDMFEEEWTIKNKLTYPQIHQRK